MYALQFIQIRSRIFSLQNGGIYVIEMQMESVLAVDICLNNTLLYK
jgi:hypothetical protein